MRKALLICLVVLAVAGAAHAQTSKADRNAMVDHLNKTKKELNKATKGLSAGQWSFKPAADRWSVAETYEHITLAEEMLLGLIQKMAQSPATPEKKVATASEKDAKIEQAVTDRSQKFKAPDPLQPTGRWSVDAMKKEFAARRAKTLGFAKNSKEDLRAHFYAGPPGEMDGVQWVLFLSSHVERHIAQINEVKADPNFPKK